MRSRSLFWVFLVFAFAPSLAAADGCAATTPGQLDVTGRRIDGSAARARAYIPYGYDDIGFQPSYVVFPTPGCWEIVASMGDRSLSFVVAVELVAPGPRSHLNGVPRGWRQTGG